MSKTQETKKKKPISTNTVVKIFSIIVLILILGGLIITTGMSIYNYMQYGSVTTDMMQNLI